MRQSSTVGLAKLGGDHTLGGSDSHLSGIVEKGLRCLASTSQKVLRFRWNSTAGGGTGAGSRANATGDRIVCRGLPPGAAPHLCSFRRSIHDS